VSGDNNIYIVETIEAIPGKTEELKQGLAALVPLSRKEKGCLFYDLYQDPETPHRFAVWMCFKDKKAYEAHTAAPYIAEFVAKYDNVAYCNVVENFYRRMGE